MTHTRLLVWGKKNGKGHSSMPNLHALPPMREAFIENVKRANFQTVLWRNAGGSVLPPLNPEDFGSEKDHKQITLFNCSSREL